MVLPRTDSPGPDSAEQREPAPPPRPQPAGRFAGAPFCTALIATCVVFFVAPLLGVAPNFFRVENWALYGPALKAGEWWRVLTAVLVHGGTDSTSLNLAHIFFNMLAVVNLGIPVERMLGTRRMVAISLVSALGSAALVLAFSFHTPTVGASGMIIGWAGALLPLMNRRGQVNLLWALAPVVVISFFQGVSWQGHLGGGLAGLATGLLLRLDPRRFNFRWPALAVALALCIWWLVQAGGLTRS